MVMGTGCVGKSTLATQLAERLNLSAVLQTDLVYEVIRQVAQSEEDGPRVKALYRKFGTDEEFTKEFERECALVRGGLEGELNKVLEEGKSIIIEGSQLDPSLYHHMLLQDSAGEARIWVHPRPPPCQIKPNDLQSHSGTTLPPSCLSSCP